ncbi:caffeoylshikimate esterase-like [Papaver somniferum]|uniref:caffeoylshikimate esterase-like n=1 Tax=Papaver somniferum TaxID=3469 RepID=UPI000E70553D|nr:caffeoylshikimate esterase-like [Papaver somniferum]
MVIGEAIVGTINYEEEIIQIPRGLRLFTCSWVPANTEPKALVFLCHGYAIECSISMKDTAIRLAKAGYGVYGIDYEGHGKSSGLKGFIPSFERVVADCSDHFSSICEKKENKRKLRYLYGESMGGAVILLLHRKKPQYWDGAILVAPMCKLADDMKPPKLVLSVLIMLTHVIPRWKIVPTTDIIDISFKLPSKREEVRSNPLCYKGRPRLKTAHELLNVSLDIEKNLQQVSLPFIIVHGGDDKVTDPSVSELLYKTAASSDKTFKLYPGMWHSLTSGEPVENIDIVFADIFSWLKERTEVRSSLRLEREHKGDNDTQFPMAPTAGKKL